MKLLQHAERTRREVGIRAEDIHKWIDGFFDRSGFDQKLGYGEIPTAFDPYSHRKFRHCREALEEAYREFEGKYTREQIRAVFETHIRDDYDGYIPSRSDFENGTFIERYHDHDERAVNEHILSKAELEDYFQGKSHAKEREQAQRNLSTFNLRIVLPTVLAIVVFIVAIFVVIIPLFRTTMLTQKRLMIKELTASASSIVQHYVDRAASGDLTTAEAQARAASELRSMRYGPDNKDYFWITDMHPRMIMHPYREDLTGHDLSNYRDAEDASGVLLFVESLNLVRASGEGYLKYLWQWMDDPRRNVLKLSYVRGIPEWGWIIGTGVYLDDVEREMSRLGERIFIPFFYITVGLFGFLTYIVLQSRRIERARLKAQVGLTEAKERYRALVEASNEGYILEVGGEHVYSNHALQRLLGYSENELLLRTVWDQILPAGSPCLQARETVQRLLAGHTTQVEFPAQLRHKDGSTIDVMLRTSRIFFSQKNGHVIAFRRIRSKKSVAENAAADSAVKSETVDPAASTIDAPSILDAIIRAESTGAVIQELNRLPTALVRMQDQGVPIVELRRCVSDAYDVTLDRMLAFAKAEMGPPPCPFSFISLGSNARREMTLFSDQDNALVFAAPPEIGDNRSAIESQRLYFLNLADRVCRKLESAGFPYCEGGVMASNPRWCMTLEQWETQLSQWITEGTPEALMEVNIAFDLRHSHGAVALVDRILRHIHGTVDNCPGFLTRYAHNCLSLKPPLTLFGNLKTKDAQGAHGIRIKDCLLPIVMFARLYSLKHRILAHTTHARLVELDQLGVLRDGSASELIQAFEFLWDLRFRNQIKAYASLRNVNEHIELDSLAESEIAKLRKSIQLIQTYQTKIRYDFPTAGQW